MNLQIVYLFLFWLSAEIGMQICTGYGSHNIHVYLREVR